MNNLDSFGKIAEVQWTQTYVSLLKIGINKNAFKKESTEQRIEDNNFFGFFVKTSKLRSIS